MNDHRSPKRSRLRSIDSYAILIGLAEDLPSVPLAIPHIQIALQNSKLFPASGIITLTSRQTNTYQNLQEHISKLSLYPHTLNNLLVYFIGHAKIINHQYQLSFSSQYGEQWLPFINFLNLFNQVRVKNLLFMLDSCSSGSLKDDPVILDWFERHTGENEQRVLLASDSGGLSWEKDAISFFTDNIAHTLQIQNNWKLRLNHPMGIIDTDSLFYALQQNVPKDSITDARKQQKPTRLCYPTNANIPLSQGYGQIDIAPELYHSIVTNKILLCCGEHLQQRRDKRTDDGNASHLHFYMDAQSFAKEDAATLSGESSYIIADIANMGITVLDISRDTLISRLLDCSNTWIPTEINQIPHPIQPKLIRPTGELHNRSAADQYELPKRFKILNKWLQTTNSYNALLILGINLDHNPWIIDMANSFCGKTWIVFPDEIQLFERTYLANNGINILMAKDLDVLYKIRKIVREIQAEAPITATNTQTEPKKSLKPPIYPPTSHKIYIECKEEQDRALAYLQDRSQPVIIWGPKSYGKSSILRYLLDIQTQKSYKTILISMKSYSETTCSSLQSFIRKMADDLLTEIMPDFEYNWKESQDYLSQMSSVMKRILQHHNQPLILAINNLDLLKYPRHRDYFDDLLGMFRYWIENSYKKPWFNLRLIISVSYNPMRLTTDINRSPFNFTEPIRINGFKPEQINQLAELHGLTWWTQEDLTQLNSELNGHPYLTRLAIHHAANHKLSFKDTLRTVDHLFQRHLDKQLSFLAQFKKDNLLELLQEIIRNPPKFVASNDNIDLLRSRGIIYDKDGYLQLRSNIYKRLI